MNEHLEGWCTDPFGRHEARWMSQGVPTVLVRDSGVESHDDPPDEPWSQEPEQIAPAGPPGSTRRADDSQLEYFDPQRLVDAASTSIDITSPSWPVLWPLHRHYWRPSKRRSRDDDRRQQ